MSNRTAPTGPLAADPAALKQALVAFARDLGLDLVGVASAAPFAAEEAVLRRREAEGRGPSAFEFADIAPRVQPKLLLPGAQAIVVAGMSYLVPDEPAEAVSVDPAGWVSRYCRGLDYHDVLGGRLRRLADWLEEQAPGARSYVHVDTEAPLDRAAAERAGLGRLGKSTNLIAPPFGTWVFLGEVYTTVALPPDEPATRQVCGSCTACIDACPTGCITPWSIDADRCLGYVTQMDGPIPAEFRPLLGNRLFGCDDCQDVCPYNARPLGGLHPEFAPRPGLGAHPDLLDVVRMDEAAFERLVGPTAAAWRGSQPWKRNALVALGNSGSPAALEPLRDALGHADPLLRGHAAWGLARLAGLRAELAQPVVAALRQRLATEDDLGVLAEVRQALMGLGRP